MAQFTITVPANKLQDFIDTYGRAYEEFLPGGEINPQTKADFAKDQLLKHISRPVITFVKERDAPVDPDPEITIS